MTSFQNALQRGQAMLEAIFILMMFVLLLFSIQFTGRLRSESLELLGESSFQTFLTSEQASARHKTGNVQAGTKGLLQTYSKQLLYVDDPGVIEIRKIPNPLNTGRFHSSRQFSGVPMQRTSYLYVNGGESRSAGEVQSRIADSSAAWRDVAMPTHRLLQPFVPSLGKIDSPWRRGTLQMDWLSRWAGQSPSLPKTSASRY